MKYSALIIAVGKGITEGRSYDKVFKFLKKQNMTVLEKSTQLFLHDPNCSQIIIVTNPKDMRNIVLQHPSDKIVHVNGSKTRQQSVFTGLMAAKEDIVLIHDAARPWVEKEHLDNLLAVMNEEEAAILAIPVADTIKQISGDYVVSTVNRENLVVAQTPQAFKTNLIIKAYSKLLDSDLIIMEDSKVIEEMTDAKIRVVKGSPKNNRVIRETCQK